MVHLRAVIVLGLWFVLQLVNAALTPVSEEGGVAFWAHVGGFVAGVVLVPFFKRREVRLFDHPHSRPFAVMPPSAVTRRGSVPPAGNRRDWR